ncbi:hypothetical protein [Microvirga terricola]|uniref:Uncharacterized protein n=1 Tax=Microvirga terricola TaxID=2719797 RepID=A0ABX0V6G7_9HYPH|nr:hypothetical protein [Microvirga terricola]NIX75168.1 hypothetical protein [Microvirga terricola]
MNRSTFRPSFWDLTPVIVPFAVWLVSSSWIESKAEQAYQQSLCHLDLPLSLATATDILKMLYPVAWNEVVLLGQKSSQCVADFHTQLMAAYTCAFIVAVISGIVVYFGAGLWRYVATELSGKHPAFKFSYLLVGIVFCCFTIYSSATQMAVIVFEPDKYAHLGAKAKNTRLLFDGKYVDINNHWWKIQMIAFVTLGFMVPLYHAVTAFMRSTDGRQKHGESVTSA